MSFRKLGSLESFHKISLVLAIPQKIICLVWKSEEILWECFLVQIIKDDVKFAETKQHSIFLI